jgi:hypothetical protein
LVPCGLKAPQGPAAPLLTSPATLAAIHHLVCGTRARNRPTGRHRPSKVPERYLGQFGERVLADIFYVQDLKGVTYAIFGIICDATLLHVAGRTVSRQPQQLWELFRQLWVRPFGYPQEVVLD